MQVNWDYPNLGQLDLQVRYGILLKLRKQQRLELPELFESRKTQSSLLEVFPTSVQLLNSLLENLRGNFTQLWEFLLSLGQVVKLLYFAGKLQFGREDVLFLNGASINRAFATITPIFYLPKYVVIRHSTDFHPLNELVFLRGIGIDSIAVGKCQHSSIVQYLLETGSALNVKREGIEPSLLTTFHPPLNCRGYSLRSICPHCSCYSGGLPGELDKFWVADVD